MTTNSLPDLGERLLPIVESLPERYRAYFLAVLEEAASARYRHWAAGCADADLSSGFRECAEREERIATTVKGIFPAIPVPDTTFSAALRAANREVRAILEGRSFGEQLVIQAAAERRGAAAWRALAAECRAPEKRAALLSCAMLEEDSAAFLDRVVSHLDG